VELSAFRPQGNALQHGGIQGALCVRLLEPFDPDGRSEVRRRDGPVRTHHLREGPAVRQGLHVSGEEGGGPQRRRDQTEAGSEDAEEAADRARLHAGGDQEEQEGAGHVRIVQPSARREYVEWVTEAKSDDTRGRRLETAVQWLAEGKIRNWKYVR
jgi:hypothetical protein